MQIDLRTVSITPLRQTFNNIAERLGGDKSASRYIEATMDVQASANFHYRPTWDPDHEIFDASRTAIKMKDWYAFKDPRQFYYGTYTIARAKMQETAEADFDFVESRGLATSYNEAAKKMALEFYLPLRHVAWGANMNGSFMCAYGFGTAITQPCLFNGMDQLGMAQYITRLGLTLGTPADLDAAKQAWLNAPQWQELRRYVEDTLVLKDWFELYVAQNVVLDGLLFPLAYQHVDNALQSQGGPVVSMMTRFQAEWFAESSKWVDSCLKVGAGETAENKAQLSAWTAHWRDRALKALAPIAQQALGDKADSVMAELADQFKARLAKAGLAV
jgi:phenol hydroxylase P1 protein